MSNTGTEQSVENAAAGDTAEFTRLVESHRRELQVHCYRMLGSLEDSEDLVQETFLRAWRKRASFEGRSTIRAWLYRIATNACLDFLERNPRKPTDTGQSATSGGRVMPQAEVSWLQPYPDRLLEPIATEAEPDAAVVARETIELAYLAAIQHLPPRQRAVLILRDVLGWPASETSALLEVSVAAANSALQRARATLKQHLPERRVEWAPASDPTEQERAVLRRYIDATERADLSGLAALLRADARFTMPPEPVWCDGRDAVIAAWAPTLVGPNALTDFKHLITRANRQPAVAAYVRWPGTDTHVPLGLDVLRIEGNQVVEVTAFSPRLFPALGLPSTL
ncbi:sigma-70 family RNA polymerase sigma factor [Kribbella deserti]|uniref:RNA polymerase sigma factor n=1 Tax=Kribbella deserti TaxID=1926257 RepID=A0ABV6QGM9_9ACTN